MTVHQMLRIMLASLAESPVALVVMPEGDWDYRPRVQLDEYGNLIVEDEESFTIVTRTYRADDMEKVYYVPGTLVVELRGGKTVYISHAA